MAVTVELAPTATIYQTNAVSQRAEQIILKHPEVTTVFTSVGTSGNAMASAATSNVATLNVKLVDKKKRTFTTDDFANNLKRKLPRFQVPK